MEASIEKCFKSYCDVTPFVERCLTSWQQFSAQHLCQPLTFNKHNYKALMQRTARVERASLAKQHVVQKRASMQALASLVHQRALRSQLRTFMYWRIVAQRYHEITTESLAAVKLLQVQQKQTAIGMRILSAILRRRARAVAATALCMWSERVTELRAADEHVQEQNRRQQEVGNAVRLLAGLCATADRKRCKRAVSVWRTASAE
jgi:hypothetical protein